MSEPPTPLWRDPLFSPGDRFPLGPPTLDARLGPDGWDGVLATPHREVRLSEVRSVWYRHPSHFELPEGLSAAERRHAAAEARCGFAGVLSSLDEVLWVNYPARQADALKPRQLHVARRCGLAVPDSVVIAYTRRIELAANGYTPTLAALDGSGGYPPGAPYDRIIATCSVPAIPPRGWSRPRPAR